MEDRKEYYAHTDPAGLSIEKGGRWQLLKDHLEGTAELARQFASSFGAGDWGYLAGLWHDLGKYQNGFQRRLFGENIAVEHAGAGAKLAFDYNNSTGIPLAFVIAGHHGGLTNLQENEEGSTHLLERIKRNQAVLNECRANAPAFVIDKNIPQLPQYLQGTAALSVGQSNQLLLMREMWTRFLFSSLVDADRLDSADTNKEEHKYSSVSELRRMCDDFIDKKVRELSSKQKENPVNIVRTDILKQCREAAQLRTGNFSLTVPTGGGKTLSGMSFALRHAEANNLRRVIVVIPYTSIIEQNAKVYRQCLGKENIVEHHSNLDPQKELEEKGYELTQKHQLATENWDAPVIVTTSVQFFETLFASKPSKARKLHNISRSVIILDEVQTLPPHLLNPILDGLRQLVDCYSCSIVLSTATPPAIISRDRFEQGLNNVQPIITDGKTLAKKLERTQLKWPDEQIMNLSELMPLLAVHPQVLCILHRRSDARELARLLMKETKEPVFHLSALMCPAHRLEKIEEIRDNLDSGYGCRVVSTQIVEAGVDIDFPVVYRALGGLDSIVQAAGRCNREGLRDYGQVIVFRAASKPPRGVPQTALAVTESMLKEKGGTIDITDPSVFELYFRNLYFNRELDEKNIQANRRAFNFATVGHSFRMIEDGFTYTVIVPWADTDKRLSLLRDALKHGLPTREHLRALQPFTVSIYEKSFVTLEKVGAIEQVAEGIYALNKTHQHLYSETYGLIEGDDLPEANPLSLIV